MNELHESEKLQRSLAEISVTGTAENGDVEVALNGNMRMTRLEVSEALSDPTQKERMLNGIKDAHEQAVLQMERAIADKIRELESAL